MSSLDHQRLSFLFNPDEAGLKQDSVHLLAAINDFTNEIGHPVGIDSVGSLESALYAARDPVKFPHEDGLEKASPFKKVANFVCYFIGDNVMKTKFPVEVVGSKIADINNHENAFIALELAIAALHGATLYREEDECILTERIMLSTHSYIDTIDALAGVTPSMHFKFVSVLLEQMAYKTNPHCQYEPS